MTGNSTQSQRVNHETLNIFCECVCVWVFSFIKSGWLDDIQRSRKFGQCNQNTDCQSKRTNGLKDQSFWNTFNITPVTEAAAAVYLGLFTKLPSIMNRPFISCMRILRQYLTDQLCIYSFSSSICHKSISELQFTMSSLCKLSFPCHYI